MSNLPTVWTNTLAGTVLAGAAAAPGRVGLLALAFSLLYTGGMYLNDAFDRESDARERPERPIPSGRVGAGPVFAIGFALLAAGVLLVAAAATGPAGGGFGAVGSGLLLAGVITAYDAWHKANPLSPVVMGLCRVLVYLTAALAVAGRIGPAVWGGAAVLLAYLVGLTYVAKQENLTELGHLWPLAFLGAPFAYAWPTLLTGGVGPILYLGFLLWVAYAVAGLVRPRRREIKCAVVSLIAGISLLDALLIAGAGDSSRAAWAVLGFALTLVLQRWVPGT
ncbi:MAG TPA: UbiA family prenyltransferase [Methylomirabilota bacterium]